MDLDIFNIKYNQVAPTVGKVLLSVPFVNDTFFCRSVVLLVSHDEQGSVGYILNKELPLKLHELVDNIPEGNFSIGIGGPVANTTLNMVHSLGHIIPDSFQITKGLYWGGNFDVVRELMRKHKINSDEIRFFMGYSGWNANQLQEEIKADSWLVTSISAKTIITQVQESLWQTTLVGMGSKYRAWAEFPKDPSLN